MHFAKLRGEDRGVRGEDHGVEILDGEQKLDRDGKVEVPRVRGQPSNAADPLPDKNLCKWP